MNKLNVNTVNETLVVDSRLIASELGIGHEPFIRTIRKYSDEVEQFGILRFENGTSTNSVGATHKTLFCYLNEDQATYVMTLSKNTDKVRQCKLNLVKAFSEAKKLIKEVIPAQSEKIKELELQNENLKLEIELVKVKDKLESFRYTIATTCPEIVQQKVLGYEKVTEVQIVKQVVDTTGQVLNNGDTINKTELCHRYNIFTKNGKPDFKRLNFMLESLGILDDDTAWVEAVTPQFNRQLKREKLTELDRQWLISNRQLFFGESDIDR